MPLRLTTRARPSRSALLGSSLHTLLARATPCRSGLGADPNAERRPEGTTVGGLRNLGQTCYANAAQQFLYGVPELRRGIFKFQPGPARGADDTQRNEAVMALRRVFAELQAGSKIERRLFAPVPLRPLVSLAPGWKCCPGHCACLACVAASRSR